MARTIVERSVRRAYRPATRRRIQICGDAGTATSITAQLTVGGVAGSKVYYNPAGDTAGQTVEFAQQLDVGSLPTGAYASAMTITEHYADGSSIDRMFVSQQNAENLDGSSESAGWGLRGRSSFTQQASSGGISLSDGAGNVESFTKNPDGSYSRPAGELSDGWSQK